MGSVNAEEIYQRLVTEAPNIPGIDNQPCKSGQIKWLNRELVKEGQDFIQRNIFAVSLAHIGALLYGFSFKTLTSVLLRTGGFGLGDATQSMIRHVETEIHIIKWYESDFLSPTSEAFKDIQVVRKLHDKALQKIQQAPVTLLEDIPGKAEKLQIMEAIKKDLDACCDTSDAPIELLTYNPNQSFSQFDMAMTQFGFFSVIFLFPDSLGIRDTRGMEGFVHLWAVIGRMLGIQDQFNLALYPNRDLYLKIFFRLGIASLKDMDLTILHLQQTYVDALSKMLPFVSLKSTLYFGFKNMKKGVPNFKGDNLYALLTWRDKMYFGFTSTIIFFVYRVDMFRKCLNYVVPLVTKKNQKRVLAMKQKKSNPTPNLAVRSTCRRIWRQVLIPAGMSCVVICLLSFLYKYENKTM